jgi:hypothetical protein
MTVLVCNWATEARANDEDANEVPWTGAVVPDIAPLLNTAWPEWSSGSALLFGSCPFCSMLGKGDPVHREVDLVIARDADVSGEGKAKRKPCQLFISGVVDGGKQKRLLLGFLLAAGSHDGNRFFLLLLGVCDLRCSQVRLSCSPRSPLMRSGGAASAAKLAPRSESRRPPISLHSTRTMRGRS